MSSGGNCNGMTRRQMLDLGFEAFKVQQIFCAAAEYAEE